MKRVHRDLSRNEIEALRRSLEARAAAGDANIGAMVRDMRLVLRKSQAEYARTCGVGLRVVSQIEAGEGNPGLHTIEKLLAPFGMRVGVITAAPVAGGGVTPAPAPRQEPSRPVAVALTGLAGGRLAPRQDDRRVAVACAVLVPQSGLTLLETTVRPILAKSEGMGDSEGALQSALLRLDVTIIYAAVRVPDLPDAAPAGAVEQTALADEQWLMSMLMKQLMAFGAETKHQIALGICKPWQDLHGTTLTPSARHRRVSQRTLRVIGATPKGARPTQMADLMFFRRGDPRLAVVEAVADSLLSHLRTGRPGAELVDKEAIAGWRLSQLVELPAG